MKTPCLVIAWAIASMGVANATIVSAEDSIPAHSEVIVETLQLQADVIDVAQYYPPEGSALLALEDTSGVDLTRIDTTIFASVAPAAYINSEAISFNSGVLNSVADGFDWAMRSPIAAYPIPVS